MLSQESFEMNQLQKMTIDALKSSFTDLKILIQEKRIEVKVMKLSQGHKTFSILLLIFCVQGIYGQSQVEKMGKILSHHKLMLHEQHA